MTRSLIMAAFISFVFAQQPNPNQPPPTGGAQKPIQPPKKKTMEEALKNKKEIPGFFTLYQDLSLIHI